MDVENNFDKEKYDYLYSLYKSNRDKQATIKVGMEKFNIGIRESKDIVDYIADKVYAEESKEKEEISNEEMPTNGLKKRNPIVKIIAIIGYCILILLLATQVGNEESKKGIIVAFFGGTFAFVCVILNYFNTPTSEHIFPFSLTKYFIHNLIYKILFILVALWLPTKINIESEKIGLIYYGIVIIAGIVFVVQLLKKSTERFRVEYGKIQYSHQIVDLFGNYSTYAPDDHRNDMFRTWVYYDIHSITKLEETFNSITIYGYIEKSVTRFTPADFRTGKTKRLDKIKITKSFKNTPNLIKALNMCVKERK